MPKELKKRGRRAEKQKKTTESQDGPPSKRRKTERHREEDFEVRGDLGDDFISFGHEKPEPAQEGQETTFYGLLTEDEQQYYTNVNNKLNANDFEDETDRANFVEAVHRETTGKEIKVASSQSCSRYLEKIIRLSNPHQLQSLFLAFLQDLDYLVQHRFGSHCCETLFFEAANHVATRSENKNDGATSFEALFIEAAKKLGANAGYLLTERFASHTIRVLLLVLSGMPLEDDAASELVASRKKEKIEQPHPGAEPSSTAFRKIPRSFKDASAKLVQAAVSGLDTTYLRALATSPTGGPMLQLLVRLELVEDDKKEAEAQYVLPKLIPDTEFDPETDSSKFISGLVYDQTGAYLIQTLVKHLPGKKFKKLYKNLFRDRIGKLAKNEIASYVAASIFERVGKDDLTHAVEAVIPELPGLVERNRLAVVRVLVERSSIRGVDLARFEDALTGVYGQDVNNLLPKMLHLNNSAAEARQRATEENTQEFSADLQGSLLAQSILRTESLNGMILDSLLVQNDTVLGKLAKNPISSRVIQVALTSETSPAKFKRQMVPKFYGVIGELGVDACGSHVVDALWVATNGIHFMKERIAEILLNNESKLRESRYGRTVWKNWTMDLYERRPREWQAIAKGLDVRDQDSTSAKPKKTAIELARERHTQKQGKNQYASTVAVSASA